MDFLFGSLVQGRLLTVRLAGCFRVFSAVGHKSHKIKRQTPKLIEYIYVADVAWTFGFTMDMIYCEALF